LLARQIGKSVLRTVLEISVERGVGHWHSPRSHLSRACDVQGNQASPREKRVSHMKPGLAGNLSWRSSLCVAALLTATFAQRVAAADDYDPSGRVARLSYLRGSVSFQPAGESDWVSAVANRPITTDDRLWADEGGRAEIQLGSATIRLDSLTGLSV